MTTKGTALKEKYENLTAELKTFFEGELFPTLDTIDIADLVYFITQSFSGINTPEDYYDRISELITMNGFKITDEQMKRVVPLITDFVCWFKAL
jgi:hypothetical protein